MEGEQMMHVDGESLVRHIREDEFVMVDFWATWCAPCRAMAPMLDRLAKEFPSLRIVKIDAEEHKHLLNDYDVRSLPNLQIYRAGQRVDQLMGKVPYEMIRRAVASAT
ncbi:thioredoxin 1 [Pseudomonas sp. JUb42]|jgi:thioredoxin 1|uniref:thioredoxin family protein n=1 Tax=Pseudomonas sp. JUb42 TaxID=2940611 RepID=UPI002168BAE9|nr:thioredoxin family protein [Pseudomonas sp. JUb42]MCS3470103.1 thioredoxin 1 [Pseudomonas sp. JUb42]